MSRVSEIIKRVRDSLADPNQERWTDDRLLRLLDEGQKTLARTFELLRGEVTIPLRLNQPMYELPENLWRITRASFDRVALDMKSYTQMDMKIPMWETDAGNTITKLIYDERNLQEIRIYPLPDDTFDFNYYTMNSPFGVLVEYEEVTGDVYGVLSNLSTAPGELTTFTSPYGVVADSFDSTPLIIMYIRDPVELTAASTTLELPPMFDTALKFYVIGHAFLDDLDTEHQTKGGTAIALYEKESALLGNRAKQHNGTRAVNTSTAYRGFC